MARRRFTSNAAEDGLGELGLTVDVLSDEETAALTQRWRETFAKPLKRDTGNWRRQGYDWHTFSFKHTFALQGEAAREAYAAATAGELLALPNDKGDRAVRFNAEATPDLDGEQDVYIVPANFSWTMAYTHEDGWCGPYFCQKEWVDNPPPPETAPSKRPRNKKRRRK